MKIQYLFIISMLFIIGCTPVNDTVVVEPQKNTDENNQESEMTTDDTTNDEVDKKDDSTMQTPAWMEIELKDLNSGETFMISDLIGKPILLESFAVWCPTCKRQQDNLKTLHEELGDSFVSIGLDTDPNEDEAQVRSYIEKNGFDWRYAIAPKELTQALIDEFGVGVVNAPSAPIILIAEDGSAKLLKNGLKSTEYLKKEMNIG